MCHRWLRQKTQKTADYHGSVSVFQELLGYITMTAKTKYTQFLIRFINYNCAKLRYAKMTEQDRLQQTCK